jgi:hypothetical protein
MSFLIVPKDNIWIMYTMNVVHILNFYSTTAEVLDTHFDILCFLVMLRPKNMEILDTVESWKTGP